MIRQFFFANVFLICGTPDTHRSPHNLQSGVLLFLAREKGKTGIKRTPDRRLVRQKKKLVSGKLDLQ